MDLSVEDPELFQVYLNCVYFGSETLEKSNAAFRLAVRNNDTGCPEINVYNICKDVTEEMLVSHFEEFGEIGQVEFVAECATLTSTYESSRVVYITFNTPEAGRAAIKARDGVELDGHQLTVEADDYLPEYELADLHYEALVRLYVLADTLQDVVTCNMVADSIEQFFDITKVHPGKVPIAAVYESTVEGNSLRKLMRNLWFYNTRGACQNRLHDSGFPSDFLYDLVREYVRVKVGIVGEDFKQFLDVASTDIIDVPNGCRYHQHDDEHPPCAMSSTVKKPCRSCRPPKRSA